MGVGLEGGEGGVGGRGGWGVGHRGQGISGAKCLGKGRSVGVENLQKLA